MNTHPMKKDLILLLWEAEPGRLYLSVDWWADQSWPSLIAAETAMTAVDAVANDDVMSRSLLHTNPTDDARLMVISCSLALDLLYI